MSVEDTGPSDVVDVHGLRITLTGSGADVVDEIGLRIRAGEILGLVGESGSGKTTVGLALLGHCRRGGAVTGGAVRIDGTELTGVGERELTALRGRTVAYVPQDPGTALNPALRISTQLREVLDAHWHGDDPDARLRDALDEVALPSDAAFLRRYPHQLSGGQQQRVAIAMAFAAQPDVVVCDEPTTGLDVTTQARVLGTVRELCRSHRVAALYVSHDLTVVAELADHLAVMYAGRIVESGPCAQVFAAPRHPYTRRLLAAVPDLAGHRAITGIPGHAPLPGGRPGGCSFHPRCTLATEQCRETFPPVGDVAPEHLVRCHHTERTAGPITVADRVPSTAVDTGETPVLAVAGLNAFHGDVHTLVDVDLAVHRHECLALVGESGSGKSTLARCVAGLHPKHTGQVRLAGLPLAPTARARPTAARKDIQYVFQNPYASLNPRRTVGRSIARHLELFDRPRGLLVECLERVALSATVIDRYPDELSGGERQRVAIARALAAEPTMLVCDEVTSALDVSVQAAIVELLRGLRAESGIGLLFITHDLALVRSIADRVAVLTGGRIVETGPTGDVLDHPQVAYTRQLLADTPGAPS